MHFPYFGHVLSHVRERYRQNDIFVFHEGSEVAQTSFSCVRRPDTRRRPPSERFINRTKLMPTRSREKAHFSMSAGVVGVYVGPRDNINSLQIAPKSCPTHRSVRRYANFHPWPLYRPAVSARVEIVPKSCEMTVLSMHFFVEYNINIGFRSQS